MEGTCWIAERIWESMAGTDMALSLSSNPKLARVSLMLTKLSLIEDMDTPCDSSITDISCLVKISSRTDLVAHSSVGGILRADEMLPVVDFIESSCGLSKFATFVFDMRRDNLNRSN